MARVSIGRMKAALTVATALCTLIMGGYATAVPAAEKNDTSSASTQTAGNPAASERWFPQDTLACIRVPSVSEFRRRWEGSSFGAMEQDPQFVDFFENIRAQLDDWSGTPRQALGLDLVQLWQATQGEIAVALVRGSDQQLALLATVDLGDQPESAARIVRQIENDLQDKGAQRLTLQAGDQDVTSWSTQIQGTRQSFSYVVRDGQMILSNTMPVLVETLARVESNSIPSLSDNAKYRQVQTQAEGDGQPSVIQWYGDPLRLVQTLLAPNLQGKPQAEMVRNFLDSSGLGQFQAIGGSVDLAAGNFDSVSRTVGYVPESAQGLLRAFALEASPQRPPNWVTDDVSLYAQINWSFPRAYAAVADFYDNIAGDGAFDAAVGNMSLGDTQLKLKEDLIDSLVGPIHVVAEIPASFENILDQPVLFAVGVRNGEQAQKVLAELARSAAAESHQVEGTTLHEITLPSAIPGQEMRLGAALAEGSFMVSTDAGYLEQVLRERGQKRPLADSLAYRSVAEQYPEQTAMISFQRQDRDFRALYEAVRTGTLIPTLPGIVSPLDFSKLPPFEAMSRYLQTTGSYIEPTPTGFRMVNFALPPREQ